MLIYLKSNILIQLNYIKKHTLRYDICYMHIWATWQQLHRIIDCLQLFHSVYMCTWHMSHLTYKYYRVYSILYTTYSRMMHNTYDVIYVLINIAYLLHIRHLMLSYVFYISYCTACIHNTLHMTYYISYI